MGALEKSKSILTFILVVVLSSCGGSDEPSPVDDDSKDREAILIHWADNIIKPSYNNFSSKLDVMVSKADAFTASPNNSSLLEFRSAWLTAYTEWQKVELFEFGPADKYTLRNFFNIYPADVSGIVANINDPAANLEVPASYPRQGFPTLDHLINGTGNDDAAILFNTIPRMQTPPSGSRMLIGLFPEWPHYCQMSSLNGMVLIVILLSRALA